MFPLKDYKYEIPISKIDPGGFATERKYDIHTGVDLYCENRELVYAIEDGYVVHVIEFTGFEESPWWNDTYAVVVKGKSGYILYGELEKNSIQFFNNSQYIKEGSVIGRVAQVLKKDKGIVPSTSMLHIELYKDYLNAVVWNLHEKNPYGLLDPTRLLRDELIKSSASYLLISRYYGNKTAKRSGVLLMNHINEGLEILYSKNATRDVLEAYCIHPILQSDEAFNENYNLSFHGISPQVLLLAMEYRRVANSYLSKNKMEDFVGFTNDKIKLMLYADKKQNEKDFALYHEGKHERSKELREYFDNWLNILLADLK